ncbi:hypothetical protein ABZ368_16230, partial [Streptomyces sp. NPDC005908]|uniref:hypothetical protein n=1 Tax=Streptomyces sp. NPDC005908 TaxID=3157084 RepID=UPI0033DE57C3
MTTIDYRISAVLIFLVSPQIRGTRQTLRNTLLPLVAVAAYYLRSFPTEGHDVHLSVLGVLVGAILGIGCGPTTRVERGSGGGGAIAKASALAAILWIVGMASRTAFEYWATHGPQGVGPQPEFRGLRSRDADGHLFAADSSGRTHRQRGMSRRPGNTRTRGDPVAELRHPVLTGEPWPVTGVQARSEDYSPQAASWRQVPHALLEDVLLPCPCPKLKRLI